MPAPPAPGWVYVLTNPAMPGLVKIGLTTRTPKERAAELSGASGVPLPYAVAWARAVSDCAYVEKAVHRMLDDRRVSGKREAFRCDVATARQVIEAAAGAKLGRRWLTLPPRKPSRKRGQGRGRPTGRRRWGGDLTGFGLAASAAILVALLVVFRPALPSWLPGPVAEAFATLERFHGP